MSADEDPHRLRVPEPLEALIGQLQQLRVAAYRGAARRYGTIAPVTRDRLEHELAIIGMKGFADYFLVVADIVAHGPTHCGRGSVANSIVSYCLGITHVEPLASGLLFERFLNPERTDPPDIDLDFPWDERDHILASPVDRPQHHAKADRAATEDDDLVAGLGLRPVDAVHRHRQRFAYGGDIIGYAVRDRQQAVA